MCRTMGKKVLLGVTGGIAAYKACEIARGLCKAGCEVYTVMTQNAVRFVQPLTFEVLTGHKVPDGMWDRDLPPGVVHIDLARETDLILIAPASANIIGKISAGIADDLLSTIVMSSTAPKLLAPAMNKEMYMNPIVQRNISFLRSLGYLFIDPGTGELACGEEGIGRLAEPDQVVSFVMNELKKNP